MAEETYPQRWSSLPHPQTFSQLVEKIFPAYRRLSGDGVFHREGELRMSSLSCPRILDKVIELFEPRSVLDIGCGTGVSMDYLIERGVDVVGIEGSELAISRSRHPGNIVLHNLNREIDLGGNLTSYRPLKWSST